MQVEIDPATGETRIVNYVVVDNFFRPDKPPLTLTARLVASTPNPRIGGHPGLDSTSRIRIRRAGSMAPLGGPLKADIHRRQLDAEQPPQQGVFILPSQGRCPRLGVVVLIVSYSVTRTTPGTGSSTTSMIVSSMTGTPCLGAFLGAIFVRVFGGRFFGVARLDAFLRAGLALAFPRFEAFLRVARFFALAMTVPCEVCPGELILKQSNPANIIPSQLAAPLLSTSAVGQSAT
jgi:hypothetical protein